MIEQRNLDRMIVSKNKEESKYSPFKCFPEYHEDKYFKDKLHGNDLLQRSFKLGTTDFLENNKYKKYSCQSKMDNNQKINIKNKINEKLDTYSNYIGSPLIENTKQILSNEKDYFDVQNKYIYNNSNSIPSENEFKKIWVNNLEKYKFQEKYHDIYGLLLQENKINDIMMKEAQNENNNYSKSINANQVRNTNINEYRSKSPYFSKSKEFNDMAKSHNYSGKNNNNPNFQSEYSNYKKPNFYDKNVQVEYKHNILDGYGRNMVTSPFKDYSKFNLEKDNGLKNMYTGNNKYINQLYLHKYYDLEKQKGLKQSNSDLNERMLNCSSKSYDIIKNN